MLKMTAEDQAKLKAHINETAALLRKYTEPEKLETFEGKVLPNVKTEKEQI